MRQYGLSSTRTYFSQRPRKESQDPKQPIDVEALLSTPTWSVQNLLPNKDREEPPRDEDIKPEQLHRLLRLSALPMPKSPEEEEEMLRTLGLQLHFVRKMQSVDTEGVEPLQSIRDETAEGWKDATIGVEE